MASFIRKTFNEAGHPLDGQASGLLKFMRKRRTPVGFGAGIPEKMMFVGALGMAPILGPLAALPLAAWHVGWGAISAPMEIGRAAVQTARFLERLGQSGPEYAGPMVDTRMAYTMRQASLQAMHDSAYSLRGAIGNEARLLHS